MRISQTQLAAAPLAAIQNALSRTADLQAQLASGKRVSDMVSSPADATDILNATNQLRSLDQYTKTVKSASAKTDVAQGIYDQVQTMLDRAKELGIAQSTAAMSGNNRAVAKAEIDQMIQSMIGLANTQYEGAYLFGGDQSKTQPFTLDTSGTTPTFTSSTPTGQNAVSIGLGQTLTPVHNGIEIFGDTTSGPLAALRNLSAALGTGDLAGIAASLTSIDNASDSLNVRVGELGARQQTLINAQASLDTVHAAVESQRNSLQDVSIPDAFAALSQAQASYQAAIMAMQRLLDMSLTTYLR